MQRAEGKASLQLVSKLLFYSDCSVPIYSRSTIFPVKKINPLTPKGLADVERIQIALDAKRFS